MNDELSSPEVLEAIAAVEHERWSHWQKFLHSKCTQNSDGSLTIPAGEAAKWTRQMQTMYADLTEAEKESDREQAREYLAVLQRMLS
jgi:hypothetical protein